MCNLPPERLTATPRGSGGIDRRWGGCRLLKRGSPRRAAECVRIEKAGSLEIHRAASWRVQYQHSTTKDGEEYPETVLRKY